MQSQIGAKAGTNANQADTDSVDGLFKQDRSSLVSRNVTIGNHRTSIRLEPDMWNGLREICRANM